MPVTPDMSHTHQENIQVTEGKHVALAALTSLFFLWGFMTALNDILIPYLKSMFEISFTQAMLVQFCFLGAYFVVSLPAGYLVSGMGYLQGIVAGLLVAALGSGLFYPSASLASYWLFLLAFFILASGITILQVAANPCVSALGKPEAASSRLTLIQAFNSLGTFGGAMTGRFIGAWVMRRIEAGKVLAIHVTVATLLVTLAMTTEGHLAIWSLVAVDLCNSIMFPTIFSLGIRELGRGTSHGSGLLCLAIVGGVIVPLLQGLIADSSGIQAGFILPSMCYLFIIYFGVRGRHLRPVQGE